MLIDKIRGMLKVQSLSERKYLNFIIQLPAYILRSVAAGDCEYRFFVPALWEKRDFLVIKCQEFAENEGLEMEIQNSTVNGAVDIVFTWKGGSNGTPARSQEV